MITFWQMQAARQVTTSKLLKLPIDLTFEKWVDIIKERLLADNYEIKYTGGKWVVFIYRRDDKKWTRIYCNNGKNTLRIWGREAKVVTL